MSAKYAEPGVRGAGSRAEALLRDAVRSTYGKEVLAGVGACGGLFDAAALKELSDPVLVTSTEGAGTKMKLAAQTGRYDLIGHDLVNHCLNDILEQGARPLFCMNYVASCKLDSEMVAAAVGGMADACRESGCALLCGETTEVCGVYEDNEFDLVGSIVGVAERAKLLPRADLHPGDLLVGLRSAGPHTNGYSIIRSVFQDVPLDTPVPGLGIPLGDALLTPHRSYVPLLRPILERPDSPIKALVHITGGGLLENIPRVLPSHLGAVLRCSTWRVPSLFQWIEARGEFSHEEMCRVFNMGIGMIAIVEPAKLGELQAMIGEVSDFVGKLVAAAGGVQLQ